MSGGQKASGVTIRQDLTDLVEELQFEELNLVADKILPPLRVSKESARYPVLPREAIAKIPDVRRAPNGTFKRDEWQFSDDVYETEEIGREADVDLTRASLDADFIDEEQFAAEMSKKTLKLGIESIVSSKLFNTTTFAGVSATNPSSDIFTAATTCLLTVKNEMDDAANAAPYKVIDLAYRGILRQKCLLAKSQFSLIASDDVVDNMIRTNEVMNSMIYTEPVQAMGVARKRQFLAEYLNIKEVIPVSAMYDTTGLSDINAAEFAQFWNTEFMLLAKLSTGSPSWKEQCIGRQPVWTGYKFHVEQYPEPQRRAMVYRACDYRGVKINTDYGVLFNNVTTL